LVLRKIIIVAALVLALILAACNGDDDDSDDDATDTPEPTAERSETPEATGDEITASPTPPPADSTGTMALDEFLIRPNRTRARPGTMTFVVTNEGEMDHEFVVIRTDIEKDELPRETNSDGVETGVDESDLDVVGRIDAMTPGETQELVVDVEESTLVLLCNLFANDESHYLEGMYTEFEVTPTAPIDTPSPVPTP
jgi:uncharacterized cupredoxin-like copper-binding protein